MFKRVLSLVLTIAMVLSMVPVQAFAEEQTTVPSESAAESTEEITAPTEAVTEPTEETAAPTESVTEPAEETTAPTEILDEEVPVVNEPATIEEPVEEDVPAPVLTYRKLIATEEGWTLGEWDETANDGLFGEDELTFTPGEYWVAFYLNTWDTESGSWEHNPVYVEFGEYLTGELMAEGEYAFCEDAEDTEYYYYVTVSEKGYGEANSLVVINGFEEMTEEFIIISKSNAAALKESLFTISEVVQHEAAFASVTGQKGEVKITGVYPDFMWPVPDSYGLSSCFLDNRNHCAIDITGTTETEVVASYGGTVVKVFASCKHNFKKEYTCCNDGFGNFVVIKHTYPKLDGSTIELYSRYSHLTDVDSRVKEGQTVLKGQTIGTIGSTGYSQGFHLDFQILYGDWRPYQTYSIDPYVNQLLELPDDIFCDSTDNCCGIGPTGCCCYHYIQDIKKLYAELIPPVPHVQKKFPSYGKIKISKTPTTNVKSLPCSKDTDPESITLESPETGEEYTVYQLIYNDQNRYWYKVKTKQNPEEFGYIFAGDTKWDAQIINDSKDVTVTDVKAPTTIEQGNIFYLEGNIKANYSGLHSVAALVYPGNTTEGEHKTGTTIELPVSTYSYSIAGSDLDDAVSFGTLPVGDYTYVIKAGIVSYVSTDGLTKQQKTPYEQLLYKTQFSVTKAEEKPVTYTINLYPNGASDANTSFAVVKGNAIGILPTPSFANMRFEGWFTEPFGGTQVTASTVPTGDMTLYAHYTYNYGSLTKLQFDANGGSLPGAVNSATVNGINWPGRPADTLLVYNVAGGSTGYNYYGTEIAVNSSGAVVDIRYYESDRQLTVPEGGFILSGHGKGSDFVGSITKLSEPYVSFNYETGEVQVFDSHAGYLAATKMCGDYRYYGELPVPTRNGYVFNGWTVDGYDASYYKGYGGWQLKANWSEEDDIYPADEMVHNGHLYERYDNIVSWTKAKQLCEAKGGHLVTITDATEQSAVAAFAAKGKRGIYRIGATDESSDGTWRWVTGETFSYNNWDKSTPEPSNGAGENYANIVAVELALHNKTVGEWFDDADVKHTRTSDYYDLSNTGFICEYEYESACNHTYTWTVTKDPTTTSTGTIRCRCSSCGKATDSVLPVLNSNDYRYHVSQAPTCAKTGTGVYQWVVENGDGFEFEIVLPKKDHSYSSKYTEASCSAYGYTTYTCSGCGDSYVVYDEQGWSEWSATYPNNATTVESRTEYRYQDKETTTGTTGTMSGWTQYDVTSNWGPYGAWSEWGDTIITANDSTKVEQRTVYGYYYFLCSNCGAHMHGYGTCYTWAGGCGATTTDAGWHAVWSPVSWDDAGLQDWYGTGKYYTNLDGQVVFKWEDGGTGTQYRSCTRAMVDTYHFYRWTDWSAWSDTVYTASDNRKVETRTVYRYLKELPGHSYSYQVSKTPTETTVGSLTGTCSVCSETTTVALPKLSTTDYTYKVTKAATCKATGTARYTWNTTTYGSFYFDVTLSETDHSYTSQVTAPSCTEQGYTTHTCANCGDNYKDNYVKELGHNWDSGVVTKAPSETETGIRTYTCGRCATTKTEVIPVLEHEHSYTAVVTAPNCTDQGYTTHTCSGCGDSYVDTYVDALDHSWDSGKVTTAATCTKDGVKTFTCTRCTEVKTEVIQSTGHSYKATVTAPSCTEKGYTTHTCSSCGDSYTDSYVDALDHNYEEGFCTQCSEKDPDYVEMITGTCGENLTWTLGKDGTLTISGTGEMTDFTSSTQPWAEYIDNIQHVVVEEGATSISQYAFYKCGALETVSIADTVTSMGVRSFAECTKLTEAQLGNGIASVSVYAFAGCTALKDVSLSDRTTEIGSNAFMNCIALETVDFPETLTAIYANAFFGCTSLETVTLPASLNQLIPSAFSNCSNLKQINIDENNTDYCSVDGVVYRESMMSVIAVPNGWEGRFVVPEGIVYINEDAFAYCGGITEMILPDSLGQINSEAFRSCTGLTQITIPNITLLNASAFTGCSNLTEVKFLGNAPRFHPSAFNGLTTTVKYPSSWDESAIQNYGGNITWIAYDPCEISHSYKAVITEANCTEQGYTTHTCSVCGDSYVDTYVDALGHDYQNVICTRCGMRDPDIAVIERGTCPDNLTWVLYSDGTLIISGSGDMNVPVNSSPPWRSRHEEDIFHLIVEEGVTSIDDTAFWDCSMLKTAVIADTVTKIGHAFQNDYRLESVKLPAGLKTIGSSAFSNCSALKEVVIPENVTEIGNSAFSACTALTSITIPGTLKTIPAKMLERCSSLTSVKIAEGVTAIDSSVFWRCSALESIELPVSLNIIGSSAFSECSALTNVVIPDGITEIGSSAFYNCTSLLSVTLPETLTTIGSSAFSGCKGLRGIIFEGDAPRANDAVFSTSVVATAYYPPNNTTWTEEVRKSYGGTITWIPDNGNEKHFHVFDENRRCECGIYGGSCGTSVYWTLDENGLLTIFGAGAMKDSVPNWSDYKTNIRSVIIENGVTTIGLSAFNGCTALNNVQIPDTVTKIGSSAFSKCTALETIQIPDNVTSIGSSAFSKCSALDGIILPKGLKEISNSAFRECTMLRTILIPDSVTSIGSYVFYGCESLTTVTLPKVMEENIGAYAFCLCSALTTINLPDGITEIKHSTFAGCKALSSITIPESVITIEQSAFGSCSSLSSVKIPNGVTTIGPNAFSSCSSLKGITIPDSVMTIDSNAFYRCTSLINIIIPDSVTNIGGGIFSGCTALTSVELPTHFTSIGQSWFSGCSSLKEFQIADNVTIIGQSAFKDCTSLRKITIPKSITNINAVAFENCTGLTEIYFKGDAPEFYGSNSFRGVTATAYYPENNETWTIYAMQDAGGSITWVPHDMMENRVTVNSADLDGQSSVWIDGKECTMQANGDTCYIDLPDSNAKTMVSYTYHVDVASNVHTQYPTGMKVWTLTNEDGIYTATYIEDLDNILQYAGSSIRVTGKQGIRMITSVEKSKKNSLVSDGLAGYTLKEYGTVVAWASQLEGGKPLVLGESYTKSNYAYKKGIADPVFADDGNLMQYTNVLVGFSLDQCKDDLAMRPYMILTDSEGNEITLYGGIVQRSIGYIALQNRDTFAEGTEAHDYIMGIIHYVYGDDI